MKKILLALSVFLAVGVPSYFFSHQVNLGVNSGYSPVTGYSSKTSSYVTAAATTIPVLSTKDPSGQQIVLSNISSSTVVKVYLNLESGTPNQEPIMCTGLTATSWTNCTRGLPFQGGSETGSSTLARAHNAGSSIIITNIGQFYNQYVSVDGNQTINDVKTFTSLPLAPTTTPTDPQQLITLYQFQQATSTGGINGSETTKGVWEGATQAEMSAGTILGSTGAGLVLQSRYATSTRNSAGFWIPITAGSGYISSTFGGVAFSMATLNGSGLVVQNPASASLLAATSSMPITSATTSTLDNSWIAYPFFGDGSSGDVTVSVSSSLSSDMYYNNLTIATGTVLNPNGFRIYVKNTLTYQGTGKIALNGGNGGNGISASAAGAGAGTGCSVVVSGGPAGATSTAAVGLGGTLPAGNAGGAGGMGGRGDGNGDNQRETGAVGQSGATSTKSLGVAGKAGGDGGAAGAALGGCGASLAGAAGPLSGTAINLPSRSIFYASNLFDIGPTTSITFFTGSAGSAGGGGGGGGGATGAGALGGQGGGGGAAGGTGGFVWIFARNIVTVNGNNYIEANGGNGGNGGNGFAAAIAGDGGGGGGAGAGGSGGVVVLVYQSKTGTGTISVTGGSPGTPGTGGALAGAGNTGSTGATSTAGNTGVTYLLQL